ncbi:MAG: helix-turn-helix domain-containing protein [Rhodococcus sp. (in: high G+C Gram-positive bacteria)]
MRFELETDEKALPAATVNRDGQESDYRGVEHVRSYRIRGDSMSTIERGYNLPTDNFTIIPNAWIRDRRLSRRARGLLIELMSHRPGWKTSVATLAKTGPEGEAAIKSAIKELETVGYLERHADSDQRGRRTGTRYVITAPPEADNSSSDPLGENRQMDTDPSGGNRPMGTGKTEDSPLDDFPPVDDHPTKKNTLQEDHLQEDLQEENNRCRVVQETHDRASTDDDAAAAAAETQINHNLQALRDALRHNGLTASFHKLDTTGHTEVSELVNRFGITVLVQAARRMHRPDSPARYVQAWLPTWRELRDTRPAESTGTCDRCVNGWIENDEHDIVGRCECRGAA